MPYPSEGNLTPLKVLVSTEVICWGYLTSVSAEGIGICWSYLLRVLVCIRQDLEILHSKLIRNLSISSDPFWDSNKKLDVHTFIGRNFGPLQCQWSGVHECLSEMGQCWQCHKVLLMWQLLFPFLFNSIIITMNAIMLQHFCSIKELYNQMYFLDVP